MNKLRIVILLIIATLSGAQLLAQGKGVQKLPNAVPFKGPKTNHTVNWEGTRKEVFLAVGGASMLGDLGGQNGEGKGFIFDVEPALTRQSFTGGARYFVREFHSVKAGFTYAQLLSSDRYTNYPNRKYRNLNAKADLFELAAHYEWHILKPTTLNLAGAPSSRVFAGNRFGAYVSAGLGGLFANPKTQFEGQYYATRPLSTEGQGLPGGPKPYGLFHLAVPFGGGVYWLLDRNFILGFDVCYRWTSTDYLDDASGYYYNNDAIRQAKGKLAALLANPSVLLSDVPDQNWYTENQPRGGSRSNDTYLTAQVSLSHTIGKSISNGPIKQKRDKMKLKGGKSPKPQKAKFKTRKLKQPNAKKLAKGGKKAPKPKKITAKKVNKKGKKQPKVTYGKKRQKRAKIISF